MLRWSIVYVLAILFLMASATAGWMGFATREAVREIEQLEASMLKLRRQQDGGRDTLRQTLSDLQTARDNAKASRDRLKQAQTAHRDTLAQLAKSEAINKSLMTKLQVAEASARAAAITASNAQTNDRRKDKTATSAPSSKPGDSSSAPTEISAHETAPTANSPALTQNLATNAGDVASLAATKSQDAAKQKSLPAGSAFSTSTTTVIATTTGLATTPNSTAAALAPTKTAAKEKRRTITSALNIRAKPSIRATRVAKLRPGQKITVTTSGAPKGWHKLVTPETLQGYIKTSALLANSK